MHQIISGKTEQGKTTLARMMLDTIRDKNKTYVYSPLTFEWPNAEFKTKEWEEFLSYIKKRGNESAFCFVDEGGSSIDRYNPEFDWLATTSRHYGHSCSFIVHRYAQLSLTMRYQCSKAFIFCSGKKDADLMYAEYGHIELLKIPQLQKGEFYEVTNSSIKKYRIDFEKKLIIPVQICLNPVSTPLVSSGDDEPENEPQRRSKRKG